MNSDRRVMCVVGSPIQHSLSPLLHNYAMYKLGISGVYTRYELLDSGYATNFKTWVLNSGLSCLNVTLPLKEIAFQSCDEVIGIAAKAMAVNAVQVKGGKLIGHNTDVEAFGKCIEGVGLKKALVIGAGGAAKACAIALKVRGIDTTIINRTNSRLPYFQSMGLNSYIISDFPAEKYDVIVNATSLGFGREELPVDYKLLSQLLRDAQLVIDLTYSNSEDGTYLTNIASGSGVSSMDGRKMLIYQAALSFLIFNSLDDSAFQDVLGHMLEVLGHKN